MTEQNSMATDKRSTGSLVVISGFSGVGKGTVIKTILTAHTEYKLSISATTRAPRPGEVNGREYHFLTREAFEEMIVRQDLIEHAVYCDNYYGTPRAFVEDNLQAGRDVILEIEVNGAMNIRQLYPDALLLFMMPPSAAELVERLSGRGSESSEVVRARLEKAVLESTSIDHYDYIVVNDTPEQCAERIHALKNALTANPEGSEEFVRQFRTDLPENLEFIRRFRADLQTYLTKAS